MTLTHWPQCYFLSMWAGRLRGTISQELRVAVGAPARVGTQRAQAGLQPAAVVERVTQTVLGKMLEVSKLPQVLACAKVQSGPRPPVEHRAKFDLCLVQMLACCSIPCERCRAAASMPGINS